mmetsp:Transcript_8055/g.17494  ORF Transcript_8055/g.17494 Transcript_8055/m.17494 type:complete len:479 (+) Transcript_8055:140-1576(+)
MVLARNGPAPGPASGGGRSDLFTKRAMDIQDRDPAADPDNGALGTDQAPVLGPIRRVDERPPGPPEGGVESFIDALPFNLWVAATTTANSFALGLELDLVPPEAGMEARTTWFLVGVLFSVCFVVEIIIRGVSGRRRFFEDIWNLADCLLVGASVVDIFFFYPSGGGKVRLFTTLRMLRIARLVRLVRMFPIFRQLWLLVGGLVNSLKALLWLCLMFLVVLYVSGILVTTEIGHNDAYGSGPSYTGEVWPYKEYFGTIWRSMFTLFQLVTLDGWSDNIVRHVLFRQPAMALFFVLFLLGTAFGLVNIIVGIIVENTLAAAHVADSRIEKKMEWVRSKAVDRLAQILDKSDLRRSGEISIEDLRAAYQSYIVQDCFRTIGVTLEEAEEIFILLDYERRGRVSLQRFANSCRELVGGAKRRDIAQVEITVGSLSRHLDSLDGSFASMEAEVTALHQLTDDFLLNTVRLLTGHDGGVLATR